MILYCDTSALIKLYVAEEASDGVLAAATSASALVVCRIGWVEAMAAFSRREREVPGDADPIAEARLRLQAHWDSYAIVEITQPLVELAADLADTFALRGYDSVQLAAARIVQQSSPDPLHFACFDVRLSKAARTLGMMTF